MAALNEKAFERKLKEMSNSQDSVQTVSLWIIHHKASCNKMVGIWLDQMKKAKPDRRLTLFYLANDAIQNSRKKGKEVIHAFKKSMKETIELLAFETLKGSVERVLGIWRERSVYEPTFIDDLLSRFERCLKKGRHTSKAVKAETEKVKHSRKSVKSESVKLESVKSESVKSDADKGHAVKTMKQEPVEKKPQKVKKVPPADFKLSKLINSITSVTDLEADISVQQQQILNLRVDASNTEALRQLKDRAGLNRFSVEFERSSAKYEEFSDSLQNDIEGRKELIKQLEDGDAVYEAANDESQIIANAYKTFGNRLNSLKKKIESKLKKFEAAEAAAEAAEAAKVMSPEACEPQTTTETTTTSSTTEPTAVLSTLQAIKEEVTESPAIESPLPDDTADSISSPDKDESDRSTPSFDEENAIDVTNDNNELADMDIEDESDSDTAADTDTSDAAKTPQHSSSSTPLSTPQRVLTNNMQSNVGGGQVIPTIQQTPPAGSYTGMVGLQSPVMQQFLPQAPLTPHPGMVPQSPMFPIQPAMGHVQPIVPSYMTLIPGYQTPQQIPGYSGMQPGMASHMMPTQQLQYPGLIQPPTLQNTHAMVLTSSQYPGLMSSHEETESIPQPIPTMTVSRRIEGALSLSTTTKTTSALPDMVMTPHKEKMEYDIDASPKSEGSAPSPEGSPELGIDEYENNQYEKNEYEENEYDENEYEENELSEETFDIINMTSRNPVQSNNNTTVVNSGMGSFLQMTSATSTTQSHSNANSISGSSKPYSAVDILAQLISRGRKKKSSIAGDEDTTSGTSTPSEVATPPPTSKPIYSLIDSLFPKLTDSLKALKRKETELSTVNNNDTTIGNKKGHLYKGAGTGDVHAAQEHSIQSSHDIPVKDGSETPEETQPQHIITIVSNRKDGVHPDNTFSPPQQIEAPKPENQGDGSWTTPETTPEHVPRSLQPSWPEGTQEPFGQPGLQPEQIGPPFGAGMSGPRPSFAPHEEPSVPFSGHPGMPHGQMSPGLAFTPSVPPHYSTSPEQQMGWSGVGPPHGPPMDQQPPNERSQYMETAVPGMPVPHSPFEEPHHPQFESQLHRPPVSMGHHESHPRTPLLDRPPEENHRPPFHERPPEEHLGPTFHERAAKEHMGPPFHEMTPGEHLGRMFHERPAEETLVPLFHERTVEGDMGPPFHERPTEEQLHRPPFHVRPPEEQQRPYFEGPAGSMERPNFHEVQPVPIDRPPDGHHRPPFHDGPPDVHQRLHPKAHPPFDESHRPDRPHFDPHHHPPFEGPPEHFRPPEVPDRPPFDMHERHVFDRPDGSRPYDGPPGRTPHRSPRRMSVDRPELAPLSPRARLGHEMDRHHRPDFPHSPFEREGPHRPPFEHPLPPSPHDRPPHDRPPHDRPPHDRPPLDRPPHDRHFAYNEPFDRHFQHPGDGPPRHRFAPPNLQDPYARDHMLKRPGPPMGVHMPYKRPFY